MLDDYNLNELHVPFYEWTNIVTSILLLDDYNLNELHVPFYE